MKRMPLPCLCCTLPTWNPTNQTGTRGKKGGYEPERVLFVNSQHMQNKLELVPLFRLYLACKICRLAKFHDAWDVLGFDLMTSVDPSCWMGPSSVSSGDTVDGVLLVFFARTQQLHMFVSSWMRSEASTQ